MHACVKVTNLIELPPPLYQLQPQPDTRVLPRPDRRRVLLVHIVQRLLRALERVEQRDEVVDRVVVVCDEEFPEDRFSFGRELLMRCWCEVERASGGAPPRGRQG